MEDQRPFGERPLMDPEVEQLFELYAAFIEDRSENRDVRTLMKAAGIAAQYGAMNICAGLTLGVLWFSIMEHDYPWYVRLLCRCSFWLSRRTFYRNRALWNDFHMTLWQLAREEWAVKDLFFHLKRANRKKIATQAFTGDWMVNSICSQDAEFKAYWEAIISAEGHWDTMPPGEFATNLKARDV